jgi:hypothetical protein
VPGVGVGGRGGTTRGGGPHGCPRRSSPGPGGGARLAPGGVAQELRSQPQAARGGGGGGALEVGGGGGLGFLLLGFW